MFDPVQTEEKILKFWEDHKIFQKSLDRNTGKGAKPFVFYEGPPTANAAPAIHHFIGRIFKDLFCRYQTMRGRYVLRKGGWDTHGLPVELQVEKALGFKNKKDIEKFGIAAFNAKCRESVWQNINEWRQFTRRIGYWVDLEHPYVTYEAGYMESLWNIIRHVWDSKLLYQAHRVVPFCTRCGTPLSSHEVAQGYKMVTDNSVYLKFRVTKSPAKLKLPKETFILAWTTTPWTLPGNVALAVGERIGYVLAHKNGSDQHFIIAKDLANTVLGAPLAIDAEFTGADLVGISYEPLFAVSKLKSAKSYKVYPAEFVSTTDGTGVVHTAVMYGEDDYNLGTAVGLPKVHTVDEAGRFIHVGTELDGRYVKDAQTEELILSALRERGLVLRTEPTEHDYPFCWRCDTPLLYYAKDSWFIRMSSLRDKLLKANDAVNWVPSHLKEGRFGQWLREGKDWAFSRERYWGTPLPIWRCTDKECGHVMVVGSLDELAERAPASHNRYWIMRHGQALSNVEHRIDTGHLKTPETRTGIEESRMAARDLKAELARSKQSIDVIVASPIERTKETAEIVAEELGVKKVVFDEALREIMLGPSFEGCHDSTYHEAYPTYRDKFEQRPADGESLRDLRRRQWEALCHFEKLFRNKNVLIIGHEYPLWMMAHVARGWDEKRSIDEKEKRGSDFMGFAAIEPLEFRVAPRDEKGELDMHRPFVDEVILKCEECGKPAKRIPELCDVWFDSGSMPFAQWHWPFENEATFKQQFPADFIAEGIDQTRGWFYTLLAVSVLMGKGAPYKNVISYSHVLDEKGQKMSKSKGNVVKPDDVIDAVGVDAARWYFYTVNSPGDPKLFSMREVRERLSGFILTLQNCVRFWELGAERPEARNFSHGDMPKHQLDRWVLSRLNGLIGTVTEHMDAYDMTSASRAIERFVVEDLSQWWLRRSRKRPESLGLLRHVLLEVDKLIAPFIPFTAEDLHMRLHAGTKPATESVHLHDWPAADASRIDVKLEETMGRVREAITAGLALRKEHQLKVRQPLSSVTLGLSKLDDDMEVLVLQELNVKTVNYREGGEVELDTVITPALRAEGFAREVARQVQDMRKEAGYRLDAKVYGQWFSDDPEITVALTAHGKMIARDTLLTEFLKRKEQETNFDVQKDFELATGKHVWLGVRKPL